MFLNTKPFTGHPALSITHYFHYDTPSGGRGVTTLTVHEICRPRLGDDKKIHVLTKIP
jgi:hypothetical protein